MYKSYRLSMNYTKIIRDVFAHMICDKTVGRIAKFGSKGRGIDS